METVKALEPQDTHFFFEYLGKTLDIDAIKIILLWNETDPKAPISERYGQLRQSLSLGYEEDFDLANAYLLLEKACSIVAALKKTLFGSLNLNSSGSTPAPEAVKN